jgi:hypothetical protein
MSQNTHTIAITMHQLVIRIRRIEAKSGVQEVFGGGSSSCEKGGWRGEYEDVGSDERIGLASMHAIGRTHVEHVGGFPLTFMIDRV